MWTTKSIVGVVLGAVVIGAVAFLGGRSVGPSVAELRTAPDSGAIATLAFDSGNSPLMPLGDPASAGDLFSRLQAERANRPKVDPTVESVFAAMKKAGVEVDEELQVSAFIVGARYCDKVRTKNDVHVVVCEYSDEKAAEKGVAFSENKAIQRREILRNKLTTCAVHQADDKTGSAEAAKIKALYRAM